MISTYSHEMYTNDTPLSTKIYLSTGISYRPSEISEMLTIVKIFRRQNSVKSLSDQIGVHRSGRAYLRSPAIRGDIRFYEDFYSFRRFTLSGPLGTDNEYKLARLLLHKYATSPHRYLQFLHFICVRHFVNLFVAQWLFLWLFVWNTLKFWFVWKYLWFLNFLLS